MKKFRVRFAPSPTGALHIGGVRTALYNYLLAKKHGGDFILRIEDTDQNRYVEGAEEYIRESLEWLGITPNEGVGYGGDLGPYRQSERKLIYKEYAEKLIANGKAYYAFDTPEELAALRAKEANFSYGIHNRESLTNSLTLTAQEVTDLLRTGVPHIVRLKVPKDETVTVHDIIRGEVTFQSNELDDKVLLKTDGMPTYHLANIVDDYLMKISHVIRGEEWLPSTAHHVLLYKGFGWEDDMPKFAHLPLILKPNGKGKLSKRDGNKLGIPVFPLSWNDKTPEDSFTGFREFGFDPGAVNNFLAFLGWNPGTEQEIFSMEELANAFSVEKIGKGGARFDFDKAKWFNQQYIIATDNTELAKIIKPLLEKKGYKASDEYIATFCGLMKERVFFYDDFVKDGYYFFTGVRTYDEKTIRKKWKPELRPHFDNLVHLMQHTTPFEEEKIEVAVKNFITENELRFGDIFPILRLALTGVMKGPSVFAIAELLGKEEVVKRLTDGYEVFDLS